MKKESKAVAVIGAGVAGCAVAGALQDYGIDFVVYDKNAKPGGLWADNYPGAKVQSTFELYEYPCKKFPPKIRRRQNPPAPTADEVCTYLEEYIEEKGMKSKFIFHKTVTDIVPIKEDEWLVEFDDFSTKIFSFVIICNGLVSLKPKKLDIPGSADFIHNGGTILHSSERRSNDIFHGKRALVIGNGKSAADAAMAASEAATASNTAPPIQIARRQVWYVPRYLFGIFQYKWAFHTRIGSALLPRYFETTSYILIMLHFLFTPIKWILWRVVELLLLLQFRLPWRLWPKIGTVESAAMETSVLITDAAHLKYLRTGKVDMRIGTVSSLRAGEAIFSDGKVEKVDVIIQATGWLLSYDQFMCSDNIFASFDFEKEPLDFCKDGLWLYRNVLPTCFRGMAFVGANTLTFMNIYTSYIQAYWLAQLLAGERPWPTEDHMKKTVEREKAFKRKQYRESEMRAASIEAYMQHYHDVLFKEMNARKPFNFLIRPIADLFLPVVPSLMKGCLEPAVGKDSTTKSSKKRRLKINCAFVDEQEV